MCFDNSNANVGCYVDCWCFDNSNVIEMLVLVDNSNVIVAMLVLGSLECYYYFPENVDNNVQT
jgi:hypothetical protein